MIMEGGTIKEVEDGMAGLSMRDGSVRGKEDQRFEDEGSGKLEIPEEEESRVFGDDDTWSAVPLVWFFRQDPRRKKYPAVCVNRPDATWMIFPLSRKELGKMWFCSLEIQDKEFLDVEGGWQTAADQFFLMETLPKKLMVSLLTALRTGERPDGVEFLPADWPLLIRHRPSCFSHDFVCSKCQTTRSLTPSQVCGSDPTPLEHCSDVKETCVCIRKNDRVSPVVVGPSRRGTYSFGKEKSDFRRILRGSAESSSVCKKKTCRRDKFEPEVERMETLHGTATWKGNGVSASSVQGSKTVRDARCTTLSSATNTRDSYPLPREYIVGVEAQVFSNPDPERQELLEFLRFRKSPDWRTNVKILMSRGDRRSDITLAGKNSVSEFREWENRLRYHFEAWAIDNQVVQAELAAITFVHTARSWWGAHKRLRPCLRVTFAQLCEWIKSELIPTAGHTSAIEAWAALRFDGNIENYFHCLDDLRFYQPIEPEAAHALAAKPFGSEFLARIRHLDKEAGTGGITFPTLKEMIRAQWSEKAGRTNGERTSVGSRREPAPRSLLPARSVKIRLNGRDKEGRQSTAAATSHSDWRATSPNNIPLMKGSGPERREFFCLVCGDRHHIWTQCQHRQTKGCAACGSQAHLVRPLCATLEGSHGYASSLG